MIFGFRLLLIAMSFGTISTPLAAQDRSALEGDWTVDLRATPQAPAYLRPMTLTITADGALDGTFYERPIDLGRAGSTNGRPCFAFRTQDGSGAYQTSGCLFGEHIEGQTWSEGRRFILNWKATRTGK